MNIAFIEPFSRAWERMKKALFKPFDLSKWFVVGFTAFLAGLADAFHGNGSSGWHERRPGNFGDVVRFPHTAWAWLMGHTFWFGVIVFALLLVITLIIVFTWLSSRGRFMFLDNVVHDRALVAKPWNDFKTLGDALFLWRIVFGLISMGIFILLLISGFILAANIYWHTISLPASIMLVMGLVVLALVIIITIAYISLFLKDFIVPIMYKNNILTNQAWGQFQPLFSKHWVHFILYGFFKLILMICAVICVIAAGLATCCIGFIILLIPYINSVILLPISYTFRAFSVEFLEQFGPAFTVFPRAENSSSL